DTEIGQVFIQRAPAFFGKAEMGPIRFQREKFAGSLCLRRPQFVRVTSFRPNRGL
ncbi:hypothetical protein, partial [Methylomonas albis]